MSEVATHPSTVLLAQMAKAPAWAVAVKVWRLAFPDAIHDNTPFRGSGVRHGKHDFNSPDVCESCS